MQAVGGASTLLAGAIAASRLDVTVKAPGDEAASGTPSAWSAARDLLACGRIAAFHRDIDAFRVGGFGSRGMVRRVHQHYWAL